MDFIGKIKNISMSTENDIDIQLSTKNKTILESLQKLFNKDKELSITIKAKSQKRSLDANAYSWLLMERIGEVINKSKDEVYIDMLGRYGVFTHIVVKPQVVERIKEEWRLVKELGEVKINGITGIQLQCYFGSSTFTTGEMSRFINGIVEECRDLGIETLSDEEINNMEKEWRNMSNQELIKKISMASN